MPHRPVARALARALGRIAVLPVLAGIAVTAACSTSAPARVEGSTAPTSSATAAADAASEPPLDLPDTAHSTVGALAEGFPSDLVELPADADILVSSAQPVADGEMVDLSLNLRTTLTAAALMDQLRESLVDAGFTETRATEPPTGVAAQSTFSRDDGELLTIAVLDRDGVRTLTLGGRVAVA